MDGTSTTRFAPVERATQEEISRQAAAFAQYPLLDSLVDSIPDVFLILNQHRQIIFANEALCNWIGLDDPQSAFGLRPGEILDCTHARLSSGGCGTTEFCRTCGAAQAILSSQQGKRAVQECRITQQDGTALDLRVWATPLWLDGAAYTVFAVKDISHEKRRRALERIFFHDLLNTAGIVSMYADLLKDVQTPELEPIRDEFVGVVSRLIDEIKAQKDLSAAENHDLIVNPTRIDPYLVLLDTAHQYSQHPAAAGKSIVVSEPASDLLMETDHTLLSRVLSNMVKNALEASQPGDTVTLSYTIDHDAVTFAVHNPGYIPRNAQLQIFQRSFSTKGSGRGLGTYSIKLLTECYLRGHVSFTTSRDQGTCFRATYPLNWTK